MGKSLDNGEVRVGYVGADRGPRTEFVGGFSALNIDYGGVLFWSQPCDLGMKCVQRRIVCTENE